MKPISDLSVMLLEDEFLIALDAEDNLASLGVKQIEVVNTLPRAAAIAERGDVDVAILDLNINGQMSFGVAEMFRERGVPVVFASGYELRGLEDAAVHLRKPYTSETLKEAIEEALTRQAAELPPANQATANHPSAA